METCWSARSQTTRLGTIVLSLAPAVIAHPFRASICVAAQPTPEATSPGCAATTPRVSLRPLSAKESGGTHLMRSSLWPRSELKGCTTEIFSEPVSPGFFWQKYLAEHIFAGHYPSVRHESEISFASLVA